GHGDFRNRYNIRRVPTDIFGKTFCTGFNHIKIHHCRWPVRTADDKNIFFIKKITCKDNLPSLIKHNGVSETFLKKKKIHQTVIHVLKDFSSEADKVNLDTG